MGGILEGILAFFAFGAIGFWLLIGGAFCTIWWFVHDDRGWPAIISIVASGLILGWASQMPVVEWLSANWWTGVQWFLKYLGIGVFYAIPVRWLMHIIRSRIKVGELERAFRQTADIDEEAQELSADQRHAFLKSLQRRSYSPFADRHATYDPVKDGVLPTYDQNKSMIGMWLMYWPWSFVDWIFGDLIKHLFDLLRACLRHVADAMSRAVFGSKANLALSHAELSAIEERELKEENERRAKKRERDDR